MSGIERFEDISVFKERIKNFNEDAIECTTHTFFRLSEKQRKVFTCNELKKVLLNEIPLKVGIQRNQNYAVYYKYREQRLLKIVLSFKPSKIRIVTFYIVDKGQMPRG